MKKVLLGTVGVDSGQLMVCDPCYIESQFIPDKDTPYSDHGHTVYKDVQDGRLWQFAYGKKVQAGVLTWEGSYEDIIPSYGMSANALIRSGKWVETDMDPTPHIPNGEFSYRGICKRTTSSKGGQLNYKLGHPGVAVAFQSGLGDGSYNVYAHIKNVKGWGERIVKVEIVLI